MVVDTLKKIRPKADVRKGVYDADYEALGPLLPLAAEFGVAMVVVHHTRKTPGADPLEEVSGSYGLSGGVDGVLVIKRERGSLIRLRACATALLLRPPPRAGCSWRCLRTS